MIHVHCRLIGNIFLLIRQNHSYPINHRLVVELWEILRLILPLTVTFI